MLSFGMKSDPAVDSTARGTDIHKPDYSASRLALSTTTAGTISLKQYASPVVNQGQTGSCVAQAVVSALELKRRVAGKPHLDLSAMGLYFTSRLRMFPRKDKVDEGTYIWLACKCLKDVGIAEESLWPFNHRNLYKNPGLDYWQECAVNQISGFYRIEGKKTAKVENIIKALLSGSPVVFGMKWGKDSSEYKSGVMGIETRPEGNHCTLAIGWDGSSFLCQNSHGNWWGNNGFYRLSPEAMENAINPWIIVEGFESYAE